MEYTRSWTSPLGGMTLASNGEALTGLWFDGQAHFAETLNPAHTEKDLPVIRDSVRWLDLYFSGKIPDFIPKLNLRTTPFRRTVWEILLTVPYGATVTYGEVAARAAEKMRLPRMSAQAVGGAVGHNAVVLIIPCHRVVGADGRLTGYAGGVERKRLLLEREGVTAGGKDR
jgi:methylated-DNA-[protein]-cysteine S-methyltransferase